jgi:hypothetical protein
MINMEWEKGAWKIGVGASGTAAGEYLPQTKEPSYQVGGEAGFEAAYQRKKDSRLTIEIEAKGLFNWEGREGAKIEWQGVKFGAAVNLRFRLSK